MHRLPTIVFVCVLAAAAASIKMVSADDSMTSGPSMPNDHDYLLGNRNCTVSLAAMEGHAAMTDHAAMSITAAPDMTLRSHVAAKDYMSDSYEGYDVKTKTHWLTTADTVGDVISENSKDGKVFVGTSWKGA